MRLQGRGREGEEAREGRRGRRGEGGEAREARRGRRGEGGEGGEASVARLSPRVSRLASLASRRSAPPRSLPRLVPCRAALPHRALPRLPHRTLENLRKVLGALLQGAKHAPALFGGDLAAATLDVYCRLSASVDPMHPLKGLSQALWSRLFARYAKGTDTRRILSERIAALRLDLSVARACDFRLLNACADLILIVDDEHCRLMKAACGHLADMSAYLYEENTAQRLPCQQLRYCTHALLLHSTLEQMFPNGDDGRGKKKGVFGLYWANLCTHLCWVARHAPARAFVCEKNEELFKTLKQALGAAAHTTGAKRLLEVIRRIRIPRFRQRIQHNGVAVPRRDGPISAAQRHRRPSGAQRLRIPAAVVATRHYRVMKATVLASFRDTWFVNVGEAQTINGAKYFDVLVKCGDAAEDLSRVDCRRYNYAAGHTSAVVRASEQAAFQLDVDAQRQQVGYESRAWFLDALAADMENPYFTPPVTAMDIATLPAAARTTTRRELSTVPLTKESIEEWRTSTIRDALRTGYGCHDPQGTRPELIARLLHFEISSAAAAAENESESDGNCSDSGSMASDSESGEDADAGSPWVYDWAGDLNATLPSDVAAAFERAGADAELQDSGDEGPVQLDAATARAHVPTRPRAHTRTRTHAHTPMCPRAPTPLCPHGRPSLCRACSQSSTWLGSRTTCANSAAVSPRLDRRHSSHAQRPSNRSRWSRSSQQRIPKRPTSRSSRWRCGGSWWMRPRSQLLPEGGSSAGRQLPGNISRALCSVRSLTSASLDPTMRPYASSTEQGRRASVLVGCCSAGLLCP